MKCIPIFRRIAVLALVPALVSCEAAGAGFARDSARQSDAILGVLSDIDVQALAPGSLEQLRSPLAPAQTYGLQRNLAGAIIPIFPERTVPGWLKEVAAADLKDMPRRAREHIDKFLDSQPEGAALFLSLRLQNSWRVQLEFQVKAANTSGDPLKFFQALVSLIEEVEVNLKSIPQDRRKQLNAIWDSYILKIEPSLAKTARKEADEITLEWIDSENFTIHVRVNPWSPDIARWAAALPIDLMRTVPEPGLTGSQEILFKRNTSRNPPPPGFRLLSRLPQILYRGVLFIRRGS